MEENTQIPANSNIPAEIGENSTPAIVITTQTTQQVSPSESNKYTPSGEKKRNAITVNFSDEEYETVLKVIEYRRSNNLNGSNGHFVKQCIDFALNHGAAIEGLPQFFGVPDDYQPKIMFDGFFQKYPQVRLKLPICKK